PRSSGLSFLLSPNSGYDDARTQSTDSIGVTTLDTRQDESLSAGLRSEMIWKRSEGVEVRAGTDYTMQRVSYDVDARFDRTLPSFGVPNGERTVGRGLRFRSEERRVGKECGRQGSR